MRAEEAKKQLLAESVRLIAEEGLEGLSFREMARRVGLSHQAPYHHFGNRAGILAAIATEGFEGLDEYLAIAARGEGRDARARLRDTVLGYIRFALANPVHFRVMFRPELVDLERRREVRPLASRTFGRLVSALSGGRPDLGEPHLTDLALSIWSGAHGVATLWLDGPLQLMAPAMDIDDFAGRAAERLADLGLRPGA